MRGHMSKTFHRLFQIQGSTYQNNQCEPFWLICAVDVIKMFSTHQCLKTFRGVCVWYLLAKEIVHVSRSQAPLFTNGQNLTRKEIGAALEWGIFLLIIVVLLLAEAFTTPYHASIPSSSTYLCCHFLLHSSTVIRLVCWLDTGRWFNKRLHKACSCSFMFDEDLRDSFVKYFIKFNE